MFHRCLRHFNLIVYLMLFTVCTTAWAQSFQDYAQDIDQRLDKTLALYEQGETEQAKRTVQMAYFAVFENLEGPIRINYSAQKSYEMEAAFGDIRKMIAAGEPFPTVKEKVDWLKNQINTVLPKLESGHQLTSDSPQNTYSENSGIEPAWHDSYRTMDDLLNRAISVYREDGGPAAAKLVQQAQYDGFKNSGMETAIRTHKQAKAASEINALFSELMTLGNSGDQLTRFAYKVTLLLQVSENALADVPAPAELQAQTQPTEVQSGKDWGKVSNQVNQAILEAIERYSNGDKDAAILDVQDAYFDIFEGEGMEAAVGAYSSQTKVELESYFTQLVGQMQAGHDTDQLRQTFTQMQLEFDRTVQDMGSNKGSWFLFMSSLLIILREGMEALLIVAAIAIYLIKSGHRDKIGIIRHSVLWALAASMVTAWLFQLLLANAGAAREILEGITMLIAVVMLFGMSYWLLSKVEAQRWQQYIQDKIDSSLSRGSLTGLWLTSFLAVYREGAETVLFYVALFSDAQGAQDNLMLGGGFIVGALILLVAYFILRYSMVRLPLKPFFIITGSFMYLMAFVFAGKGISELIEGKLFIPTLIGDGSLKLTWLGIYPYWETLLPQLVLVVLALIALWVLFFRNKSGKHV